MNILFSAPPPGDCPNVPPQPSCFAEYVLNPFYDFIVLWFPESWSPNKVTLFGIMATLLSSLLLLTGMPSNTLFEPPYGSLFPSSVVLDSDEKFRNSSGLFPLHPKMLQPFLSFMFPTGNVMLLACSFLNAVYCIADNTDGRLARRLNKASEIGEYLDHGLDCVTSLLSTCVVISVLGISFSNLSFAVFIVALETILCHTLNYERKIFIWGNRFFSVDEAMLFFFVGYWIPILFPQMALVKVSPALLNTFLPRTWAETLHPLRCVEVVLIFFLISQMIVVLDIVIKNWKMLFRITTLALFFNAAFLIAVIPYHTRHIMTQSAVGYMWGPFSYVALWFITAACTSSTVAHTLIFAHCASLPHVDLLGLVGLFFVWFAFFFCPAGGMVVSVVWHIGQILIYVQRLQSSARKALQKTKRN